MTWTRLDDVWTDMPELADLDFADRWHYLAMIQFCSRTGKIDGVMRTVDALRCSDNENPSYAVQNLAKANLVQVLPEIGSVQLLRIDDHIPPPSVRNKAERDKIRKRRERAHKDGDHSLCVPDTCPNAPVTRDKGSDKGSDPGTGQDRTGRRYKDVPTEDEKPNKYQRPVSPLDAKRDAAMKKYAERVNMETGELMPDGWDVVQPGSGGLVVNGKCVGCDWSADIECDRTHTEPEQNRIDKARKTAA